MQELHELDERLRHVERTAYEADAIHRNHDAGIDHLRTTTDRIFAKLDDLSKGQAAMGATLVSLKEAFNGGWGEAQVCREHQRQLQILDANVRALSEGQAKGSGARRIIIDLAVVALTILTAIDLVAKLHH